MLPRDASGDGHRIDATLHHALGSVAVTLAVVVVALAVLLLRGRRRAATTAPSTPSPERSRWVTVGAVVLALTVFVGVDLRLALRSRRDLRDHLWNLPHGPDVVRVEILARQWSWQVRLPGPDDTFGTADDVVSLDDLRVPVGRPVSLQLRALDVVHSLFLPHLRVRQDAIPGHVTRTWFRPTLVGAFDMVCGQFCGQGHYRMRGTVHVLSPTDHARWLRDAAADALRAHAPGAPADTTAWMWQD